MTIGTNIKRLRKGRMTQEELAEEMGVAQTTIARWESGGANPSFEQVKKLAELLEITPSTLAFGEPGELEAVPATAIRTLPVIGPVEAGSWREAIVADEPLMQIPFHPNPNFPAQAQVGFLVRGESCNLIARDGDIVVAVPYEQVPGGVEALLEKDTPPLVIAQRDRAGFIEATVKELRVKAGEIQLWPKSSDPAHQEKVTLNENGDTEEIRITHVVVQAINHLL